MFAPTRLKSVLLTACLFAASHASAQTTSNKTLGDMIDQAKRSKSLGSAPLQPTPAAKQSKSPAKTETLPVLWSLTGINHQLVAEVIYKETVHTLKLHEGDKKIGPWSIDRYGANGLYLKPEKPTKGNAGTVFLPAPAAGTSLQKYAAALPAPVASLSGFEGSGLELPPQMAHNLGRVMPPQVLGDANAGLPPQMPANAMAATAPPAAKAP